jgi:hypothetical protein
MSLTPLVSSTTVPFNANVAFSNSWITVKNDQGIPLFAQVVYPVNTLGNNGLTIVTGTSVVSGNFSGFQTIASTVITGLTASNGFVINSGSGISGVTFPANFTINGFYKAIQLSSGSVLAYNA